MELDAHTIAQRIASNPELIDRRDNDGRTMLHWVSAEPSDIFLFYPVAYSWNPAILYLSSQFNVARLVHPGI
eukprot:SAG31_NODE_134_length_23213_cov_5.698624_19_plen_72_part_00